MAVPFEVQFFLVGGALLYGYLNLVAQPADRPWNPLRWPATFRDRILPQWPWFMPLAALGILHTLNVNVVDPIMRDVMLETGIRPAEWILAIEGNALHSMLALQGPVQDFLLTWFYLVFHHALLVGMPFYLIAIGSTSLARRFMASSLFAFFLALPFFLLLPTDNPHIHYGDPLALERAIPGVESFYYRGTSIDNTFPSLHNAFAMMLVLMGWESGNPRMKWSLLAYGPILAFSTVYLQVHWLMDIVGGGLVGFAAWKLAAWLVPKAEARWASTESN